MVAAAAKIPGGSSLSDRLSMLCVRVWTRCGVRYRPWRRNASHVGAARLDLSGIYPPIATPFTAKEDVDYQKLEENLQKYDKIPFKGWSSASQSAQIN